MINRYEHILTIDSCISELPKVEYVLNAFFKEFKIPECYYNKTLLCLNEAVLNSIEHGNCNDASKKVSITLTLHNNKLSFTVQDEGKGFNFESIENPTKTTNLLKESGRGIHIIKSVADNIVYNQCGNSIQVEILCQ